MPAEKIRFIHEAKNDREKAGIFAAARSGHIAVLLGSTSKMGVGTNVQTRLTALHHIDCPWRPADLEQGDGRGIRQGNQNDEVRMFRYVVERSFDAYSWQTLSRKAMFIAQVMRGRLDVREIEDIGSTALSATEAKALASGNPLVLEHANAESTFQELRRKEIAHQRSQSSVRFTAETTAGQITVYEQMIRELKEAGPKTQDVAGENFRMTVGQRTFTSRADAAEALGVWANSHLREWFGVASGEPVVAGHIAGHDFQLGNERASNGDRLATLRLKDVPGTESRVKFSEVLQGGIGLIRSLENKTLAIPRILADTEARLGRAREEHADATARFGAPFAQAEELKAAEAALRDVERRMAEQASADSTPGADDPPAPGDGAPDPEQAALIARYRRSRPDASPTAAPRTTLTADAARPAAGRTGPRGPGSDAGHVGPGARRARDLRREDAHRPGGRSRGLGRHRQADSGRVRGVVAGGRTDAWAAGGSGACHLPLVADVPRADALAARRRALAHRHGRAVRRGRSGRRRHGRPGCHAAAAGAAPEEHPPRFACGRRCTPCAHRARARPGPAARGARPAPAAGGGGARRGGSRRP